MNRKNNVNFLLKNNDNLVHRPRHSKHDVQTQLDCANLIVADEIDKKNRNFSRPGRVEAKGESRPIFLEKTF